MCPRVFRLEASGRGVVCRGLIICGPVSRAENKIFGRNKVKQSH